MERGGAGRGGASVSEWVSEKEKEIEDEEEKEKEKEREIACATWSI
jgi:hypothetical protein